MYGLLTSSRKFSVNEFIGYWGVKASQAETLRLSTRSTLLEADVNDRRDRKEARVVKVHQADLNP